MGRKRRNSNVAQMVVEEESYSSTKYEKRLTKKTSRYGKNDDNRSLNLKTRLSAQTEAQGQMIASIVSNTITVAKGPAGCVDKESLILTDKGLMTLEEIILLQRKDLNFLGFEKFTKNLMVLSHDKTWNPITDIYATEEDTEGYIITTKYGNKLKCSWKHPLYTINSKGDYEWVKAINLKKGQQIGIYVNNNNYEFEKDELMEFIGYYFADGYLGKNGEISFTSKDKNFLQNQHDTLVKLFNCSPSTIKYRKEKNNYSFHLYVKNNKVFNKISKKFHIFNGNKEFHNITKLSLNEIKSFLNGLFRDITITSNTLQFSNKYELNVRLVKSYLYLLGIRTGDIKFKSNKYNGTYRINILSEDIPAFINLFGNRQVKKGNSDREITDIIKDKSRNTNSNIIKNVLDLLTASGGYHVFGNAYDGVKYRNRAISYDKLSLGKSYSAKIKQICEDKFFWDEIISIEPIKQKFYDISVKDKSSFICNNMISHNTGKTCVATLKAAQMLNDKEVDKVILTRPVVEIGKSMGFLPGSIDEKYEPYLVPFKEHLIMAFGKSGYEARLNKSIFPVAINFVQGQTWDNAVILIDEVQNMTAQEMYMVLTRIGRNSKAILTGDIKQTANGNLKHDNGLADLEKRYRNNTSIFEKGDFGFVEFTSDDIVRSDIVRRIIEMYEA